MTSQPVLEMLWETAEPRAVLGERFGFVGSSEAVTWLREVLLHHYDISLERCQRIVMSDTNALAWASTSSGPCIVKWSVAPEKFARLVDISELTAWLAHRGHPVSAPVLSRTGQTQVAVEGVSLNVQRVIPGRHLDVTEEDAVHAAGAMLARLHLDLLSYPVASNMPGVPAPKLSTSELISSWLESDLSSLPDVPLEVLRARLSEVPEAIGEPQLVHGDFRAANILTEGLQVTALLDFEEMRFDSAVGELARSAVMLGTLFHDWGPVPPQVHDALLDGYESVRPLTARERSWWQPLLLWWSLLMVPATGTDPTGWAQASEGLARALTSRDE